MKRILFLVLLLANTTLYSQNTDNEKGLISLGTFFFTKLQLQTFRI